jgi:hypothetical protein
MNINTSKIKMDLCIKVTNTWLKERKFGEMFDRLLENL